MSWGRSAALGGVPGTDVVVYWGVSCVGGVIARTSVGGTDALHF